MPDKKLIPVEQIHDTHHPQTWFEHWQHNDFFYGHQEMQDKPDAVGYDLDQQLNHLDYEHTQLTDQQNDTWTGYDFHGL